jgi:hypothetical protein
MRRCSIIIAVCALGLGCDRGYGVGGADFSARLSGSYYLSRTSTDEVMISPETWNYSIPTIPAKVVECAVDGRFILAKRQAFKTTGSDAEDIRKLSEPGAFDYWILDVREPRVFGPLQETAFARHRQQLGISDSIVMRDIYEFRPWPIELTALVVAFSIGAGALVWSRIRQWRAKRASVASK